MPVEKRRLAEVKVCILCRFAKVTLGIAALTVLTWAQSKSNTAEIRGSVKLQGGALLTSALVTAKPVPKDGKFQTASGASVLTGKDGSFRLVGLSGGVYHICVFSPKDETLDPCEWSETPPQIEIPPGGVVPALDLVVVRGVTLKFRIDDLSGVAPTKQKPQKDAFLQPGVRSANGVFHRCRLISSDRTGHDYHVVVPRGADFDVQIDAYNLQVTDQSGETVTRNRSPKITANEATLAAPLRFRVTRPDGKGRQ